MTTIKSNKDKRWSYLVAALFGGFVIFILACVGFASFQHFDLVDREYYDKGIAYQTQIDQMNRVSAMPNAPTIAYDSHLPAIVISFPVSLSVKGINGCVTLFRPSDATLDRNVSLAPGDDGKQIVNMAGLPKGKWQVKMSWQYEGVSYYQEKMIVVE